MYFGLAVALTLVNFSNVICPMNIKCHNLPRSFHSFEWTAKTPGSAPSQCSKNNFMNK